MSKRVQLSTAARAMGGSGNNNSSVVHDSVKDYYGKILSTTKDLKTSACTSSQRPTASIRRALQRVPKPVLDRFYGCGTPLPSAGLNGLSVLDLGSGSGRDCYVAAALVGETGNVTGLDMTDELLQVAREHADEYCQKTLGYSRTNLKFIQGYIEDIPVAEESTDLIISNCVVNLSPDKPSVLRGMWKALKYGGEAYFSDVYCDRRLPQHVREDKVLWGECLSGALYQRDFVRIANEVGFLDCRILDQSEISIGNAEIKALLGNARFFSITYRLFKLREADAMCEDYGQVATYLGTLGEENQHTYKLDENFTFETGRPKLVCGNTAAILSDSWLKQHFKVVGDRSTHFGSFLLPNTLGAAAAPAPEVAAEPEKASCCSTTTKKMGCC